MFTLLTNARVFSPEDLGLCSLLIHADRIVAVEKDISLFDGVNEVIDCRGKWVIPGIIDQHVHLTGGGGEAGFASRTPAVKVARSDSSGYYHGGWRVRHRCYFSFAQRPLR